MEWVNRLAAILVGLVGIGVVREFFSRYDVLVFSKNDVEEAREEMNRPVLTPVDLRGTPTHACICGSEHFYIRAMFHNFELATYFLDMQCTECGALLTAPTPLDREITE
ncbi:MAG: hypothetical protein O3A64_03345 [Proteobacteria bacterium]|nr:hypothetical protein [Pseudomonadota bacterium]